MKKTLSIFLSSVIIASTFSACSLSDTPASENSYDGGAFSKETIRILSGSENKVNIVVVFDGEVRSVYDAEGANSAVLEDLYNSIAAKEPHGGICIIIFKRKKML